MNYFTPLEGLTWLILYANIFSHSLLSILLFSMPQNPLMAKFTATQLTSQRPLFHANIHPSRKRCPALFVLSWKQYTSTAVNLHQMLPGLGSRVLSFLPSFFSCSRLPFFNLNYSFYFKNFRMFYYLGSFTFSLD